MNEPKGSGIIDRLSHHPFDQTVERLLELVKSRGLTVFAVVDHSGEAEKVGLKMRPTKLVIFGSAKAGTPLMIAAPSSAIDLPLKILVSTDAEGQVWVSYNAPEYLQSRHGVPAELLTNITGIAAIATAATE